MNKNNPIAIRAIDHVVIATSRVPVLQDFYEQVLGCRVERTVPQIGLVQMRAGQSMIDLVPKEGDQRPGRNMEHVCLTLETWNIEAIQAHLERHGIAFEAPAQRYGATGMGPSIYIRDPDGNRIELKGADTDYP